MMPAVHEKMITPTAFLVNAIKIIPMKKKIIYQIETIYIS